MTANTPEIFWGKVDIRGNEDCWEWKAGKDTHGYGRFLDKSTDTYLGSHRMSWRIHFGDIPDGMCVCHKCDNPACVNPNHLFLGTHKDNMDDMVSKGRGATGEKQPTHKLKELEVFEIRRLYSTGKFTEKMLGKMFRVCFQSISFIVNRKTWTHIGGD